MKSKMKVVNIERGLPTVEVAGQRLGFEINTAKREGVKAIKIIHGYGSSGTGGKIKEMVGKTLSSMKRAGNIRAYVSGEDWNIFNQSARDILDLFSELRKDSDLQNPNPGITIVLL